MNKNVDVNKLTFNNLYESSFSDFGWINRFESVSLSNMDKPWIVESLLYVLSDQNPGFSLMKNESIEKILGLMLELYDSTWSAYFDICDETVNIEKLIENTEQTRYCFTEAANGYRVATAGEVEAGLKDLVNDPVNKLEKSEFIFINMFTWAVTGRWRYYIKAGYECKYNSDGSLKEPEIKYIMDVYDVLIRMCELLNTNYYNNIISKLKKIKKLGEYKYPNYAEDEYIPEENIAFIQNYINKNMPSSGGNGLFNQCYRIIIHNKNKSISKYTTDEKITLRKGYDRLTNSDKEDLNRVDEDDLIIKANKALCDQITKGINDGLLKSSDFSARIVGTIAKNGYKRISDKQKSIIVSAIEKIENNKNKAEYIETLKKAEGEDTVHTTESIGLSDLSNMLGSGKMK